MPYLVRYLNNFISFGSPNSLECLHDKEAMLEACSELNALVNHDMSASITVSQLPQNASPSHLYQTELLQLIGKPSFACNVVGAGRIFLRRLLNKSTEATPLHYHFTLNEEICTDMHWWLAFLPSWSGTSTATLHETNSTWTLAQ